MSKPIDRTRRIVSATDRTPDNARRAFVTELPLDASESELREACGQLCLSNLGIRVSELSLADGGLFAVTGVNHTQPLKDGLPVVCLPDGYRAALTWREEEQPPGEVGSELLTTDPGALAVAGFSAQQVAVPVGTVCGLSELKRLVVQGMTVVTTDVSWSGWVDSYSGRAFEPRVQGLSGVILGVPGYVSEQTTLSSVGDKGAPMLLVPVRTAVPVGQALGADIMRPKAWEAMTSLNSHLYVICRLTYYRDISHMGASLAFSLTLLNALTLFLILLFGLLSSITAAILPLLIYCPICIRISHAASAMRDA